MKCWICGGAGTTGEHRIKRSDLRSLFRAATQADPLYFHDGRIMNRPVGSLDAKVLKSPSRICPNCNNVRTQPHDRAWERMSDWLRTRRPAITPATIVRANRVFPYDTAREMRNVHLYFIKQFGCQAVEGSVPIDVASFANAILRGRPHPHVYLRFGCAPRIGKKIAAGGSDVKAAIRTSDGTCAFATWFYYVGHVAVNIVFSADAEGRKGLVDAWHPRFGTNRLVISDFR